MRYRKTNDAPCRYCEKHDGCTHTGCKEYEDYQKGQELARARKAADMQYKLWKQDTVHHILVSRQNGHRP